MFIGRESEIKRLLELKKSNKAELAILYGRRRVGKSTLLEYIATEKGHLYFEAIKGLPKQKQISHFIKQLNEQTKKKITHCSTWEDAFDKLTPLISKGYHILIFDEFPWMASEKKELVAILKYYWDRKWKKNKDLKLILCGSVANFIFKHLIHSEALHNRKTLEMQIQPLPAKEAKLFFKGKRSNFEICKFLITFGGIPKYLEQINPNQSYEQNLDRLCFNKNAFFLNEFETIFKEQFKVIKRYESIVEALSKGPRSKEELEKITQGSPGGGFTIALRQLETAGFIKADASLNIETGSKKTRTRKYRLWDEWLKFYFQYVKKNLTIIKLQNDYGLAHRLTEKSIHSYFGLGFEMLCLKNIPQILQALNIDLSSIIELGPYFKQASRTSGESGLQIDLCLLRRGGILTIIECKFSENPVGTEIIKEIELKLSKLHIPRHITIEKVLIAACGITTDLENRAYFHHIIGLEAIF
jgi:AAA+ ATPase superfamily predicted ATPase